MKTKMLSLILVVLSLQAIPMNADSNHFFSPSRLKRHTCNAKSWLNKKREKHVTLKKVTVTAGVLATTAVVAYLCRGKIKSGYENLGDIYHVLFNQDCDSDKPNTIPSNNQSSEFNPSQKDSE